MPEIRQLQTVAAHKGRCCTKEAGVTRRYGGSGPGSHAPFRITGRGVHLRGELKGFKPEGVGKPKGEQP